MWIITGNKLAVAKKVHSNSETAQYSIQSIFYCACQWHVLIRIQFSKNNPKQYFFHVLINAALHSIDSRRKYSPEYASQVKCHVLNQDERQEHNLSVDTSRCCSQRLPPVPAQ